MEGDCNDSRIVDRQKYNDTIDVTDATPLNTTRSRGFSFLDRPNQSDLNLSRSLLDTGELDSAFYGKVPVMSSGLPTLLKLKLDASQSIPA